MARKVDCNFPLNYLSRDSQYYYAVGGGGSAKTGIQNGIVRIPIDPGDEKYFSTGQAAVSCLLSIHDPDNAPQRLVIYSTNEYLITASVEMEFYGKTKGLPVEDAEKEMLEVRVMKYIKRTRTLFVGWSNGVLQMYALENRHLTLTRTLEGHEQNITGMAISAHKRRVFTTANDRTLKVWDVESGDLLQTVYPENLDKKWEASMFWGCVVSYNGDDVILGLFQRKAPSYCVVIDSKTFRLKKTFFLYKKQISSALTSEKTRSLACVGMEDGSVVSISLLKYKVLCVKKHHNFIVTSSSIDLAQMVASTSFDSFFVATPIMNTPYGVIGIVALILFMLFCCSIYYVYVSTFI